MLPVIATLPSFHPFLAIYVPFRWSTRLLEQIDMGPTRTISSKFRPDDVEIDKIFSFFCKQLWDYPVIPLSVWEIL